MARQGSQANSRSLGTACAEALPVCAQSQGLTLILGHRPSGIKNFVILGSSGPQLRSHPQGSELAIVRKGSRGMTADWLGPTARLANFSSGMDPFSGGQDHHEL
jgi:hypothetical protein